MKSETASKSKKRGVNVHDVSIGKRIRVRRNEIGLSQEELGVKLGVSFQQIQKYEKGVNRVSSGKLPELARVLEVPVNYFFEAQGSRSGREAESIIFDDPRFSIRLLRAYSKLPDDQRRQIVSLMESMAGMGTEGAEA
jgi:transcriptional regulator with XRE-family HTH domain